MNAPITINAPKMGKGAYPVVIPADASAEELSHAWTDLIKQYVAMYGPDRRDTFEALENFLRKRPDIREALWPVWMEAAFQHRIISINSKSRRSLNSAINRGEFETLSFGDGGGPDEGEFVVAKTNGGVSKTSKDAEPGPADGKAPDAWEVPENAGANLAVRRANMHEVFVKFTFPYTGKCWGESTMAGLKNACQLLTVRIDGDNRKLELGQAVIKKWHKADPHKPFADWMPPEEFIRLIKIHGVAS